MGLGVRYLALVVLATCAMVQPAWSDVYKIVLPSGTKVKLELAEELSSNKSKTGEEVIYFVKEDVVVGDNKEVLIKKGAKAIGKVTRAKGAKSFGRKGKLEFTVEGVEAVDGKKVPLRSEQAANGKGRGTTVVAVAALVTVLGVFIKGKNAKVPKGTMIEAYVDENSSVTFIRPDSNHRRR